MSANFDDPRRPVVRALGPPYAAGGTRSDSACSSTCRSYRVPAQRAHTLAPSLQERRDDIPALARHYLTRSKARQHRAELDLSEVSMRAIHLHAWPGNLRELRNAIERAVILSPGPTIETEDLGIPPAAYPAAAPAVAVDVVLGADVALEAVEREHIARVIARASTLESAARILGIDATTLQRKRKRYGLA